MKERIGKKQWPEKLGVNLETIRTQVERSYILPVELVSRRHTRDNHTVSVPHRPHFLCPQNESGRESEIKKTGLIFLQPPLSSQEIVNKKNIKDSERIFKIQGNLNKRKNSTID